MNWTFDKSEPEGIPDCIRRDKNNRAPFMGAPLKIHSDGSMTMGGQKVVSVVLDPFTDTERERIGHLPLVNATFGSYVTPATNLPETARHWVPPWQK